MLAARAPRCGAPASARNAAHAPVPLRRSAPVRAASSSSGSMKNTRSRFNIFSYPHKWLSGGDAPSPKEQFKYSVYHKYGVLRDDFYVVEVPEIKEAVRRLPKKVREAREMRIKRASDAYIKKQFLPQDQWTTPYEDVPYLDEYLSEVNKEEAFRKAFRVDIPPVAYHQLQAPTAAHFAKLHKLRPLAAQFTDNATDCSSGSRTFKLEPRGAVANALERHLESQTALRLLRAIESEQLLAPPTLPPQREYHEDTAPPLPADWDAGDEGREVEFKRLDAEEAPVRAIYKHVRLHANAFLNADGGTILFGISDRGRVLGLSLGSRDRDTIRIGIDQIFMHFYPRIDPLLYHVTFRRVSPPPASPSKAGTSYTPTDAERFVLTVQVRRGLAPIYFVSSACNEAYIRGNGCSMAASQSMISQRLGFGKPPPLTFAGLCIPLSETPPSLLRAFSTEWEIVFRALRRNLEAPPVFCIEGGPLSGKTSFVAKLAAELSPIFSEGLLEIDWTKEAQPLSKWQRFENRITPSPALSPSKDDKDGARYEARLMAAQQTAEKEPSQPQSNYWHTRRYIIILENVPAGDMIRSIMRRRPRGSLLLITSARRPSMDIEWGAVRLNIGPWSVQRREEALRAVAPQAPPALIPVAAAHAHEEPGLLLGIAVLLARCTQPQALQAAVSAVNRDTLARRFSPFSGVRRLLLSLALLALPVSVKEAALLWDVPPATAALILHVWLDHYAVLKAEADRRAVLLPMLLAAASVIQPTEQDVLFIEGAIRTKARLTPLAAAWAIALNRPALAWLALVRCARP